MCSPPHMQARTTHESDLPLEICVEIVLRCTQKHRKLAKLDVLTHLLSKNIIPFLTGRQSLNTCYNQNVFT